MEKRSNRRDRSDSRESPQTWSRRRVHQQPSPPSSIHNTGTSLGRTRIDRQGPQPAERQLNNRKGRPRQSAETNIRFDSLELKGPPLLSVSKDPSQLPHDSADWRRRSASPTSSPMLDSAASPHQRLCDPSGGRKQEKCLSASVPSRHNGQTKRSVEIGEDNRVTVRLHRHAPSTEARTAQEKRHLNLREYNENAARVRQARPQVASPDLDRRLKSRDPRLARKAGVQAGKSDGSLSRRERRLSPSDDETSPVSEKPPQIPPAAERDDPWEEAQSRSSGERPLRKDYPSPGGHPRGELVGLTQAPALYRKPPKALGAGLERAGSGLARISSDSAPTDPRRQRVPRTFPRGGSARCAASHTVPSTKSTGSFMSEENQGFTPSDDEASVAGYPNIPSGDTEPRRLSPGHDVRTERDGGRQFVKNEPPAYTQDRGEGVKPASAGFACRSSHILGQNDRIYSETVGDGKACRPEPGQYGVKRAHRLDGDDAASRNNEGMVMRRQLALSIEGVTLGGTGVQLRHSPAPLGGLRGVHVRLPLQGHHAPPIAHELPLKGSATLPLHRESSPSHPEQPRFRPTPRPLQPEPPRHQPERPSFYREPPTSHYDPQLIHREPPPFHREPTSIHREPTSIRREPTSIHREPTSIHREPTSIHREPPPIKHEPQPIRYEPPLVRREPPPRHIEMRLPPGQGMRPLHPDPSPMRDRQNLGSPPGLQSIPRAFGPANQSARMLPEQCPRLDNRVPSEQFRAHGMSEGYDCDGAQFRSQHPQTDRPHGRMTPPPSSSAASLPFAEDDGQRRSAYAQAMHNKRFMRRAPEEEAVRSPAQLEVGRRGPGTPTSGIESAVTAFGPPNAPMHLPQQIPQQGYPQESRFQGTPPDVQRGDGFRGNLSSSHAGDHGDGFDRGAPVETYSRHPWDSFSDDDDAEFPLEHTSPEWTPACAVKRPEQGTTSANPSSDHDPVEKNIDETMAAESIEGERSNDDGNENDNEDEDDDDNGNDGIVIEAEKSEASKEASRGDSHDSRERLDEPSGDVPHVTLEVARDSSITTDVQNGAQPTVGSCAADIIVKETARRRRRLEPTPLAQVSWGVGDLKRFPRLDIPDNLTHVVASWAALDTRAIGVIPMICQPMVREPVEDKGEEERKSSKGKRKRVDGGGTAEVDQVERGVSRGRTWGSRVLVPFGLIPERAAEGCWAEALRLVVAAANPAAQSPEAGIDDGGEEESGNGGAVGGKRRASGGRLFTLPGGLWNAELDGGDPEEDDNKALIGTAVRACKASAGVDLSDCSHWLKFCELHEDDRVTVVFLCGGGVRAVEGASEDLCVATIADLIQGGGSSGEDSVAESQSASDATFEARLGAEFLWGLVSRDWAALMLDCLRLYAKAPDGGMDRPVTPSDDAAATVDPIGRREKSPQVGRQEPRGQDICEMIETPAEVRAAFGLYDMEGEGCVSGEHLETWLFDAGFRLSARYLKSLLRSLCRATEDGKRLLFEYRRRLGKWGPDTHDAGSGGSAPPQPPEPNKAVQAANGVDLGIAASGSPPTVDESVRAAENFDARDGDQT